MASVFSLNPYGVDFGTRALGTMDTLEKIIGQIGLNKQQGLMNAYLPQEKQLGIEGLGAKNQLMMAQAQREQALANLPFGGMSVPGPAGQIVGLEMLRQSFGENSPQYQSAKQLFDLGMQGDLSRINYQNALTQTMPIRSLTPLGKEIVEQQQLGGGRSPTGAAWENLLGFAPALRPGQGVSPINKEAFNQYGLKRQKETTDEDTRKRNLLATNIEKTVEAIDVDSLTRYAGASNAPIEFKEGLKSIFGKESPEYDQYKNSLNQAKLLAKQVRQFYGDSIQPVMQEQLSQLTNPNAWLTNPNLMQQMFYGFKNTLANEMETYRSGLRSTDVFQGKDQASVVIPKDFPSKEAFQNWFKSLTPGQQENARKQLGGR